MPHTKAAFAKKLNSRLSLRLHMTFIVLVTGLSGLLGTRLLLAAGVENIAIRYPLAVVFAYLVFFAVIKLWLKYLAISHLREERKKKCSLGDVLSNFDIPTDYIDSGGGSPSAGGHYTGGGGQFLGGGSSGDFGDAGAAVTETAASTAGETAGNAASTLADGAGGAAAEHGAGAAAETAGDAACDALSGIVDGETAGAFILVVAAIAAVAAVVFGSAAYLISEAPVILSEAAFDFVLAASLIKSTRRIESADWVGSVFRTTWKPFSLSLAVAFAGALYIHSAYPNLTRISELFR
jgi:hypothetical protein